jgi:hypothetical protein
MQIYVQVGDPGVPKIARLHMKLFLIGASPHVTWCKLLVPGSARSLFAGQPGRTLLCVRRVVLGSQATLCRCSLVTPWRA